MKVLVIDAGNSSSYHVLRSVARKGHEVHLVAGKYCHWLHSKYCGGAIDWPDDIEGNAAYFKHLSEVLAAGEYDLLFSCGDAITEAIYAEFTRISDWVECGAPGPRVAPIVFSKREATRFVGELGVPIPKVFSLEDLAGGGPGSGDYHPPYPVVVKGQKGSGSSNVRFVLRHEQLAESIQAIQGMEDETEPPTIQEYVGGPGYLVHLLFWHGEPYAVCCHRKDREYPFGGGVTSAATTVDAPALKESAIRIGRALEWHGLMKLDFVFDPLTKEFKFIEIDPRVSASIDIARAAGVDQVAMLCDLVEGKDVEPKLWCQPGVKYRWLFPRDLLVGAAYPATVLQILPDLLRKNVHFDLGLADWKPLYYQLGRFVSERKYRDKTIREKARAARELRLTYEERITRLGGELAEPA